MFRQTHAVDALHCSELLQGVYETLNAWQEEMSSVEDPHNDYPYSEQHFWDLLNLIDRLGDDMINAECQMRHLLRIRRSIEQERESLSVQTAAQA